MENLNSGSIYKLASIKWLLVTLLIGFSCVAFADDSNDYVVHEYRGSWENSVGAFETLEEIAALSIDLENADVEKEMTKIILNNNPKMSFSIDEEYAHVDISLSDDSESMQPDEYGERDCSKLHTNTILYLYEGTGKDIKLLGSNDDYELGGISGRFRDQFSKYKLCDDESGFGNLMLKQGAYTLVAATFESIENSNFLLRIGAKSGAISKYIFSECNENGIYCIDLSDKNKQEVNATFYPNLYQGAHYYIPYKSLVGADMLTEKDGYTLLSSNEKVVKEQSVEAIKNKLSFLVTGLGKTTITIKNKKNEYVKFLLKVNAPQFSFKFSKSTVDVWFIGSKTISFKYKALNDDPLSKFQSTYGLPHINFESNDPFLNKISEDAQNRILKKIRGATYSLSSSDDSVVKIVNNRMQFLKPGSANITLKNTIYPDQSDLLQVTVLKGLQKPLKIAQWRADNEYIQDPDDKWWFQSADKILEIEISGGSGTGDLILYITNNQNVRITDMFTSYAVTRGRNNEEDKWRKIPQEDIDGLIIKNPKEVKNEEGGKVRLKLKLNAQRKSMTQGHIVLNVHKKEDDQYLESEQLEQKVFFEYSKATAGFLTEAQYKWNPNKGEFSDPEYTAIIPYNKENKYQHDGDRPSIQISEFLSLSKVKAEKEKENVKKDIKYFLYVNNQKYEQGYKGGNNQLELSVNENTGELTYSGVIPESENNQFRVCTEILNGYYQNSSRYFANLKFNSTSENSDQKEWDFKYYFIQNCYKFKIVQGEQNLVLNDPYLSDGGYSFNVLDEPDVSLKELIDNKSSGDGHLNFKSNNLSCVSINEQKLTINKYGCVATIIVHKAKTKNWKESQFITTTIKSEELAPKVTFIEKPKEIPFIKSKQNGLNFAASFDNKKFKGYSIKYASSDTNVANIDKNGIVKVHQAGDTTITVTASGRGYVKKSREYVVSFVETPLTPKFNLNLNLKKNIGFTDNPSEKLSVAPDKQSGIKFEYTSSDSSVANVDVEGNVTVKKVGQATITVIANGHGYSKATKDYVLNFVKTKLVPDLSSDNIKVPFTKEPISFDLKGMGIDSSFHNITYKSSDPNVATVNKETGKITLKKLGNVQVTATVTDNESYFSLGASKVEITRKYNVIQGTLDIETNNSNPKLIEKTLDNDEFYIQDHIKNNNKEFKYSYKHRSVNLQISDMGLVNISKDGEYMIEITRMETEKYESATDYIVIKVSPLTSEITVNTHQEELDGDAVKVSLDFNVEEDKVKDRISLELYLAYDDKKLNFKGVYKDTLGFPEGSGKPILEFPYDNPESLLYSIKNYKAESVNKEGSPNGQAWYSKFKKLTNAPSTVQVEWSEDTPNGYIFDGKDGKKLIDLLSAKFERKLHFKSGSTDVEIIQRIESSKSEFVLRKIANFKINADQELDTSNTDESDSKANPDPSNTDKSDSGVVDSKVIEKTVKTKFEISNNEATLDISSLKKSLSWNKDQFNDCNIYVSSTKFPDPSTDKQALDTYINTGEFVNCWSGDIVNLNSLTLDDHESYYVMIVASRHGEQSLTYSKVDQFRYDKLTLSGEQVNSTGGRTKHVIEWQYHSTLGDKKISLYYDPDAEGNDGQAISDMASDLSIEDGEFTWDTSQIPEGEYYLYAKVRDESSSQSEVYYSENPITIKHDHGLAMDCSAMFNYPGGHLKAPYHCNRETLALRGPSGKVIFFGKHNNLNTERYEENVFRVYPSQSNFLIVKENGHNSFYYDGSRSREGNFTQNMTISSKEDAFIGVDNNNIALNYPATYEEYFANWEYDFEQYKALGSYAVSKKEDLINNGSIANLVYQLPLESGEDAYQISESNFVDGDVFTSVVTNTRAKAALTKEGRIKIWGHHELGGVIFSGKNKSEDYDYDGGAPDLNQTDFVEIYPHLSGFSAMKKDNSVIYWGLGKPVKPKDRLPSHLEHYEGFEEMDRFEWPTYVTSKVGDDFSKVYVNYFLFFGIQNGSVKVWHSNVLVEEQFTLAFNKEVQEIANISNIHIAGRAVTLEDEHGDLYWIPTDYYENPKPQEIENPGFTKIYSNEKAFAGITAEGKIQSWGASDCGGSNAPSDKGYIAIYSTYCSFVAVKADGTYSTWGKMGEKRGTLSPKTIMVTGTQKDVHNDQVEVSLEYNVSDGATNHQYLNVHMHYDSEKLTWIGFDTNTALGIHDKYKSPDNNILEKLNDYEFGELNLVGNYPVSGFISAGTNFGEINTDRLIYLKWGWNFNSSNRTFSVPLFSSEMGFTGNNQLPVALIKGYFVRKDGFDSGTTKITFTNAKPAEGNPSASYEFKSSSLIIEANPNTSSTDNSGD